LEARLFRLSIRALLVLILALALTALRLLLILILLILTLALALLIALTLLLLLPVLVAHGILRQENVNIAHTGGADADRVPICVTSRTS
jgi:hypothetical protein